MCLSIRRPGGPGDKPASHHHQQCPCMGWFKSGKGKSDEQGLSNIPHHLRDRKNKEERTKSLLDLLAMHTPGSCCISTTPHSFGVPHPRVFPATSAKWNERPRHGLMTKHILRLICLYHHILAMVHIMSFRVPECHCSSDLVPDQVEKEIRHKSGCSQIDNLPTLQAT